MSSHEIDAKAAIDKANALAEKMDKISASVKTEKEDKAVARAEKGEAEEAPETQEASTTQVENDL